MGNTVGSTNTNFCNFFSNEKYSYILGLWCADSYWWSSSVGLSNTNPDLIKKFRGFLEEYFPKKRIKFTNYHLFVNSRPLLRDFICAKNNLSKLKKPKLIKAYIAGRFDGDGSIDKNLRNDCRIVYGEEKEAKKDRKFLKNIGINKTRVYHYKKARTFCLYISRYEAEKFIKSTLSYSIKLQKLVFVPRRDLTLAREKRV